MRLRESFVVGCQTISIVHRSKLQGTSKDKKITICKSLHNKECGTRALLEILRNAHVHELLDDNPYADPNINYNKLHSCIIELKEDHITYKLTKFDKYKHKWNEWITDRIIKSLKFRDKLYEEMKSLDPNSSTYFYNKAKFIRLQLIAE